MELKDGVVHLRNCLHKCNRTQVRPATNEEASELKMVWTDLSEDVRRGKLRHYTDTTQEGEPEEDEEMGTEDNVPDVRHGRPDVQPEPERSGMPEGSAVEPSQPSVTVPELEEEKMTTDNASTDVEEPSLGERRVRTLDDQTIAMEDVGTAIDNAAEQEDSLPRGKVPRLDESGNKRNNDPGRSGNMLDIGASMSVAEDHRQTLQSRVEKMETDDEPSG